MLNSVRNATDRIIHIVQLSMNDDCLTASAHFFLPTVRSFSNSRFPSNSQFSLFFCPVFGLQSFNFYQRERGRGGTRFLSITRRADKLLEHPYASIKRRMIDFCEIFPVDSSIDRLTEDEMGFNDIRSCN